jgi:hypothetical protein
MENKYFKVFNDNWFKLVVIIFLFMFYNQLNDIKKYTRFTDTDVSAKIDYFSNEALRQLKGIR